MSLSVSCPRCGGTVRPPDLMHSEWRCDRCGPVLPLHVPRHIDAGVLASAVSEVSRRGESVPLWCPWPLPPGWTVTGVGWAADNRAGVRATVLAASGPSLLTGGPADLLLVAETPGIGVAGRYAGLASDDPGPPLADAMANSPPHAKPRTGRHPTPMWSIPSRPDRSAYVGEAWGMWLVAVAWPPAAGYLLADELVLLDLTEWLPSEMVFGAPCERLHHVARNG